MKQVKGKEDKQNHSTTSATQGIKSFVRTKSRDHCFQRRMPRWREQHAGPMSRITYAPMETSKHRTRWWVRAWQHQTSNVVPRLYATIWNPDVFESFRRLSQGVTVRSNFYATAAVIQISADKQVTIAVLQRDSFVAQKSVSKQWFFNLPTRGSWHPSQICSIILHYRMQPINLCPADCWVVLDAAV